MVEILKTKGDTALFSPEMELELQKHKDPENQPGLDLLGALLAVSTFHSNGLLW